MIHFLIFISCLIGPVVLYTFETVPLTKDAVGVGEPFWDIETQNLYFADFEGTLLFRYSWSRNTTDMFTVDGIKEPSYFIPVEGSPDRYLITAQESAYVINWDGSSDRGYIEQELFTVVPNVTMDSFFTTEAGELFTGTISPNHCDGDPIHGFYRYTRENGLEEISRHFISSTGITIFGDTLYHMDGCQEILSAWNIDPVTRALGAERTVIQFTTGVRYDGLASDQDGILYTTSGGSPYLIKIDPRIPAIVEQFPTPTDTQTLAFGGPDMKTLFVSPINVTAEHIQQAPAGDLLLVGDLPAPGVSLARAVV